jgi:hypothetical protein
MVTGWTIGRSRFVPRQRRNNFSSVSRPALGPTQPFVQCVPGVLSPGQSVTLTTHPHLVPGSRMSRSYTFSPPIAFVACSGTPLALVYIYFQSWSFTSWKSLNWSTWSVGMVSLTSCTGDTQERRCWLQDVDGPVRRLTLSLLAWEVLAMLFELPFSRCPMT